jgi:membrane associated rhomboid family serine protease
VVKALLTKSRRGTFVLFRNGWRFKTGHAMIAGMENPKSRNPRSAGVFIALGAIIGVIYGTIKGEPSVGLVAGLMGGVLITGLFWLIDRRRQG